MNDAEGMILFGYWQMLWREASPTTQHRWRNSLIIYLVSLILGIYLAATQIPSIVVYDFFGKVFAAVWVGPMSLVWLALDALGLLSEAFVESNLGWMLPGFFHGVPLLLSLIFGFWPVNKDTLQKRAMRQHEANQGRLEPEAAAEKLPVRAGILLSTVTNKEKKPVEVGVDFATGQGHVMVVAATRAGKGLHLTDVLTHWPGPAIVVDPKSEQMERTSGFRHKHLGPVYRLPGHRLELSRYYDFLDNDDIQELHDQLLRPDEDAQRIFADKSLTFFKAIGHFARARKLDPLRVLLDAAEDDFQKVLIGLDRVPAARPFVRQFTNGKAPEEVTNLDRFVASAYGTFTTRLFGYQKHIDTIAPPSFTHTIPHNWAANRSTLYITYSLNELVGVGGVVAAILAGIMRDHMKYGRKQRLLIAIDEMAAVRLRHLDTYLATVGGFGITLLLYAQSKSQLVGLYGQAGTEAILSNCAHQLWYPPKDLQTAQYLSNLYGTKLKVNRSYSTVSRIERQENGQMVKVPQQSVSETLVETPVLSPTEVQSLGEGNVFVFTGQDQQLRFIGQRLDSRELYDKLPPPVPMPKAAAKLRVYTDWLFEEAVGGEQVAALSAEGSETSGSVTPPGESTKTDEASNFEGVDSAAGDAATFGIVSDEEEDLAAEAEADEAAENPKAPSSEDETAVAETENSPAEEASTVEPAEDTENWLSDEMIARRKKFDDGAFQ